MTDSTQHPQPYDQQATSSDSRGWAIAAHLSPLIVWLLASVTAIVRAVRASNGDRYRYPFSIRFVSQLAQ